MILHYKFRIVFLVFTIIFIGKESSVFSQTPVPTITYEISAGNLSLKAIDCYPQKLLSRRREDSLYIVKVSTFEAYKDTAKRKIAENDKYAGNKRYPRRVRPYLEPTPLTDFNHPEIKAMTDSIIDSGDSLTLQIIMQALKYSSKRIKYDNALAMELDKGRCTTLPVEAVLERGKGTCSEYTNLFIALARSLGIPCRMAVGYIYMPDQKFEGSHAWAECYINNYGWLAMDPQNGFIWYPPVAVKLFHGKDFTDCRIKTLPDMYPVNVKILK